MIKAYDLVWEEKNGTWYADPFGYYPKYWFTQTKINVLYGICPNDDCKSWRDGVAKTEAQAKAACQAQYQSFLESKFKICWIKVEDRLPDEDKQDVLFFGLDTDVRGIVYKKIFAGRYRIFKDMPEENGFYTRSGGWLEATHWMPMPEGPGEEA